MQSNIITEAENKLALKDAASSNNASELYQTGGLILSSLFTVLYMVLSIGGSLIIFGWSEAIAYPIGALLGIAAVAPGEGGVYIWKTKLKSDTKINKTQRVVAWFAGLAAAVTAAISTVSFFAYLLQGIMPQWYNAEFASGVNVVNIAASWAIFCIAVFVYSASSSDSKYNMERANALNLLLDADAKMFAGLAAGLDRQSASIVAMMDKKHLFLPDAITKIARAMNLPEDRIEQVTQQAEEWMQSPEQQGLPQQPSGYGTIKSKYPFVLLHNGKKIGEGVSIEAMKEAATEGPLGGHFQIIDMTNGEIVGSFGSIKKPRRFRPYSQTTQGERNGATGD